MEIRVPQRLQRCLRVALASRHILGGSMFRGSIGAKMGEEGISLARKLCMAQYKAGNNAGSVPGVATAEPRFANGISPRDV